MMKNIYYFQKRSNLDLRRAALWQIETGIVRATTWIEDDSLTTLGFWGAGDIVGTPFQQQDDRLECLTPVTASPLLAESCSERVMLAYIHQLQELLVIRSCKRIEEMLLKLLTWLGKRFGEREEAGLIFRLCLTHQDLAEALNSSRVTITRSMGQLERQGLIRQLTNHRLFIDKSAYSFANVVQVVDPVAHQLTNLVEVASPVQNRSTSNNPLVAIAGGSTLHQRIAATAR